MLFIPDIKIAIILYVKNYFASTNGGSGEEIPKVC